MNKSFKIGFAAILMSLAVSAPVFAQDASQTVSKAQKTLTEMQNVIDGAAKRNANKTNAMAAPSATTMKKVGAMKKASPAIANTTKAKKATTAKKKKP